MNESSGLIIPGRDMNTAGVQPSELDTTDALIAVHRRMVSAEQAVTLFRQHLNDALIEIQVLKEAFIRVEKEIEYLRTAT